MNAWPPARGGEAAVSAARVTVRRIRRTVRCGTPAHGYSPYVDQEPDGLDALAERAMRIHALYDRLNLAARGRTWNREESMLGFVGDVGDLAKIVMAEEGARPHPTAAPGGLAHELADCLWSVLVLARLHDIDLGRAFTRTMAELETAIIADLARLPRPGAPA